MLLRVATGSASRYGPTRSWSTSGDRPLPSGRCWSIVEDLPKGLEVVGVDPSLGLTALGVVEHADDPGRDIDAVPARSHHADGARHAVVSEHLQLLQPEATATELAEPCEEIVPAADVPGVGDKREGPPVVGLNPAEKSVTEDSRLVHHLAVANRQL